MKKLFQFTLLFLSLSTPLVYASGVMSLKGKIVSFDANEVSLETAQTLYKIDRKELSKDESSRITRSEVEMTLSVPLKAIKSAKARSKR